MEGQPQVEQLMSASLIVVLCDSRQQPTASLLLLVIPLQLMSRHRGVQRGAPASSRVVVAS
jgi:hypothetical protein